MSDELKEFLDRWSDDNSTMLVHTSGSTGKPKAIHVSKLMMIESARMTIKALELNEETVALLSLPIKYISGQMMVVRSIVGHYHLVEGPISSHPLKNIKDIVDSDNPITFAAMTPMQVYNTSLVKEEWNYLSQIDTLIIGGGAISMELEDKLQNIQTTVYATYGMTETLSHIALRRVNGASKSQYYTPLDGVAIATDPKGKLHIDAPKICKQHLVTNDIVELRQTTNKIYPIQFRFVGRIDNVINSGGIKVHIEQVEYDIIEYFRQQNCILKEFDFAITSVHDVILGEMVVLLDATDHLSIDDLSFLNPIIRPKKIIRIDQIPLTETNKVDRKACCRLASENIHLN